MVMNLTDTLIQIPFLIPLVMISSDEVYFSINPGNEFGYLGTASVHESKVTQQVNIISSFNAFVPFSDHCFMHLINILKRSAAIPDYVEVTDVEVRCQPDGHISTSGRSHLNYQARKKTLLLKSSEMRRLAENLYNNQYHSMNLPFLSIPTISSSLPILSRYFPILLILVMTTNDGLFDSRRSSISGSLLLP